MIRATAGVWANYATTVLFQVLLAARYGSGMTADVFVITFAITLGLGAILTGTAQSIVVPRLLGPDGELRRTPVRLMFGITVVAALLFSAVAVVASPFSASLGPHVHAPASALVSPLRFACAFLFLQVVASQLISISLAMGGRFIAAVAPGLPSTAGMIALALERPTLTMLYLALATGAACEILVLALSLRRPLRLGDGAPTRVGAITLATAAQFAVLNLIPSIERVVASAHGTGGAAHFNYALRSLTLVQQLLVGGFVLSALGDWSALSHPGDRSSLRRALVKTSIIGSLLLTLAASIAVVAGHDIVALVYQHGAFGPRDTTVVARLLLVAVAGFWAEGVGLILSQAMIAQRQNGVAVKIGFTRFVTQVVLIIAFGHIWGATGVAAAYSAAALLTLLLQGTAVARLALVTRAEVPSLRRAFVVVGGTVAVTALCAAVAKGFPAPAQALGVVIVFSLLVVDLRRRLPDLLRHA